MSLSLPPLRGTVTINTGQATAAFRDLKASAATLGKDLQASLEREGAVAFQALTKNANMFEMAMKGVSGAANFAAAAIGTGMAAAAAAFVLANKALLDYSDKVTALKDRTGLSTDALQVLGHMAKVSGTDVDSLAKAVTRMEVNLGKGDDAFKKLGLSIATLKGLSPDAAFEKIGTAIGSISDPMQRASAAVAIFGRAGAELLPVFAMNLGRAREEASSLGLVLSGETISASDALGDAMDTAAEAMEKFAMRAAGVVQQSPAMIGAVEEMARVFGAFSSELDKNKAALVNWVNIAAVASADFLDTVAATGQLAVGIGKFGGAGWAIELSGVEKLTDGFRKMTTSLEDAVIEKIRWSSIDMGGKWVLLPGGVLPKQGKTGGTFDGSDMAAIDEANKKAIENATRLSKAEDDWYAGARKYAEELEKINRELDKMVAKALASDYGGLAQSASRASLDGAVESALGGRYNLKVPTGADGKPKQYSFDNSRNWAGDTDSAAKAAERWALGLQGVALMAGAIGGKIGATANVMANIAKSFEGFSKMDKNGKFNAIAGAAGQIGGLIGGTAGAGIQGAAGGAMAGFSVGGPVGAVVGGLAGGIMGIFGANAAKKKELTDLKTQLSGLSDEAKKFGISLDAAFASKNSSVVKGAIDSVNAAMKESQKRISGLNTAAGGLNQRAKGGAITDQASADRAGREAMAIFGGQVKESGDVMGALNSIGPALDEIARKAQESGLALGAGLSNLIQMRTVLAGNQGLADEVSGLNAEMKGLSDSGLMTKELFRDFGADAGATFDKLVAGGLTANQSMSLMQPTLQQLYEGEKLHGWAVDESTQALIDQGVEQGIVGDQFMSANERMVELLGILVEAVGGKLPDSFKRAGDAAGDFGRRASKAVNDIPRDVVINVRTNGRIPGGSDPGGPLNSDGTPDGDGDPSNSFAGGTGFRNFGSGTRAMLHGEETVMTRPQVDRLVGMAVAGAPVPGGGRSAPTVTFGDININANDAQGGRDAAAEFERLIVDGRILTILQQRLGLR